MTLSPASGPGHPNGRWGRLPNASHLGHLPCPFFAVSPIPVHSSSSPFPARLVPVPNPARPTLFSYPSFALFPLQKRPRPSVRPSQSLRRRPASHSPPAPASVPAPARCASHCRPTPRHTPPLRSGQLLSVSSFRPRTAPFHMHSVPLFSRPPLRSPLDNGAPEPVPAYSRLSRRCALGSSRPSPQPALRTSQHTHLLCPDTRPRLLYYALRDVPSSCDSPVLYVQPGAMAPVRPPQRPTFRRLRPGSSLQMLTPARTISRRCHIQLHTSSLNPRHLTSSVAHLLSHLAAVCESRLC